MPNRSPWASAIRLPLRSGTVGAVEADQGDRGAGIAGGGLGNFEHGAVAVRPAPCRCAEQVPAGVGDQTAVTGLAPLVPLKLTRVVGVLA